MPRVHRQVASALLGFDLPLALALAVLLAVGSRFFSRSRAPRAPRYAVPRYTNAHTRTRFPSTALLRRRRGACARAASARCASVDTQQKQCGGPKRGVCLARGPALTSAAQSTGVGRAEPRGCRDAQLPEQCKRPRPSTRAGSPRQRSDFHMQKGAALRTRRCRGGGRPHLGYQLGRRALGKLGAHGRMLWLRRALLISTCTAPAVNCSPTSATHISWAAGRQGVAGARTVVR